MSGQSAPTIPLERELQERLAWFVGLRWLAAAFMLAAAAAAHLLPNLGLAPGPLAAMGLGVGAYNVFFSWLHRRVSNAELHTYRTFVYFQIGLDWLALSGLVHFGGGVKGPVPLAFAFHLGIAAILLSRRACYLLAAIASVLLGFLAATEAELPPGADSFPGAELLYRWLLLAVFLGITAFLTTSITAPLRRKEKALAASEQRIARAYAEVEKLGEERVWFARLTHHQLRAPLSAADNLLDALSYAGPLHEKQADLVARGRRRLREALDLIGDLLELAAAQRSGGEGTEAASLHQCLRAILEGSAESAALREIAFEVDLDDALTVRASCEDLRRIFANLLENAFKYTPGGGRVRFAACEDRGWVRAQVSDSGIGFDRAERERIFEEFYRSPAARQSEQTGTGLGLAIVARLVERWGGRLRVESKPGEGSSFCVELPAAPKRSE